MNGGAALVRTFVLGLVVSASTVHSYGQTDTVPRWRPIGLQGTSVRSLATGPDLLCAGTQGQGVYCKNLPQGTWGPRGLAGKTVPWLWINPLQPNVMFAATDAPGQPGQLYRTLNSGLSWETSGAGLYIGAIEGVAGTNTLYAAGGPFGGRMTWEAHGLQNTRRGGGGVWRLPRRTPRRSGREARRSSSRALPSSRKTAGRAGSRYGIHASSATIRPRTSRPIRPSPHWP